ncbi:MAG TPA: Spy/CpxP family protein refolding chaperone [Xanthobacteraceae bacterium]|nr:Spy/CpxP family protein refolding chaperone [Xanthobacteraceae bacterium]
MKRSRSFATPATVFALFLALATAVPQSSAQDQANPPQPQPSTRETAPSESAGPLGRGGWRHWGPGMMMGPAMMARSSRGFCNPGMAGFARWRIERMVRVLKPTEAQNAKLEELKAASAKAAEMIASECPREVPRSVPARLEHMEKRLETMLQAVKVVRPAFDAFYASLDEEQKVRLNDAGPRGWGWRHWGWRDR